MARIGITVGDPAGIGPEVVELALATAFTGGEAADSFVVYGPMNTIAPILDRFDVQGVATGAAFTATRGAPSAMSGRAALDALMAAIADAKRGEVHALCTAPLSKEALHFAGSADRGHTEILARELGLGPTAMAFFGERLRTALVTAHLSLRQAIDSLHVSRIVEVARLFSDSLSALGLSDLERRSPRLALAALNPHAGEAGLLGSEEGTVLEPAVLEARSLGVDLHGPLPADTVYRRTLDGEFDGVVSLYHDQALIPLKLLGFGESTNVTLGLSVPRTSPDHGTAFDRVGSDSIRAEGMQAALSWATRFVHAHPDRSDSPGS